MLALHSCDNFQLWVKNGKKKSKNCKIHKKSENFKTPCKNLEKYGSFSEFRIFMEKSIMFATLDSTNGLVSQTNSICNQTRVFRHPDKLSWTLGQTYYEKWVQ